ncbi:MAG: zinc-ribbon domain-containing protein [Methanobrevibacter sp.]|nr:zinc-ribbon domain-containing protein [Methanobrevibacter sp.]
MTLCSFCEVDIPEDSTFCPYCGKRLPQEFFDRVEFERRRREQEELELALLMHGVS